MSLYSSNNPDIMPNDVVMLSVIYSKCCNALYRYAECYYLEFHYAEYQYVDCLLAECCLGLLSWRNLNVHTTWLDNDD